MFGSLLILLILPLTDLSLIRGNQFRPAMKLAFWFFVVDFIILMWIGSQHPTTPFVEIGQVATAFYFSWFLLIVPIIGLVENTIFNIALDFNLKKKGNYPTYSRFWKIFIKDVYIGIKSGFKLPLVPAHIANINKNKYIKIFKIIGSISMFLRLSGIGSLLKGILFYIVFIFSILYILYKIIYGFYALKNLIYYIYNGTQMVGVNYSSSNIVTIISQIMFSSIKNILPFSISIGLICILASELDVILNKEGKESIFIPGIKSLIGQIIGDEYSKYILNKIGIKD